MRLGICGGCDQPQPIENIVPQICTCGGAIYPLLNLDAFRTGRLASRLGEGYYAHVALMEAAREKHSQGPGLRRIGVYATRKNGTTHSAVFDHYLGEAFANDDTKMDLARVWLTGALLRLGDELARHQYFDRAPILEMVRHLRNGIAHGNRFRIDRPEKLLNFPANNIGAAVREFGDFNITPDLNGREVLFDYMDPGDVVDVLLSTQVYLHSIAIAKE